MIEAEVEMARAPDPESLGRVRRIVASAHKWGGDGAHPHFRKIRTVLLRKHPEVIAKAFGGNANVAAAWIKNNWYRMRGQDPPATRRKKLAADLSLSRYQEVPRELFGGEHSAELFCASGDPERQGDLIWVTAFRTGQWAVNPIRGGKGPLVIDKSFMDDMMEAWRDRVWEYVTVPTYHTDQDVLANTGFVRDLRVVDDPERPGGYLLRAAIEFKDPDTALAVERGTIAGVSVNVKFDVRHQETGKLYRKVLTHIALTNMPFINGLRAFEKKLAASMENGEAEPTLDDVLLSYEEDLALRAVDTEERDRLAKKGNALPDGSFPIANVEDLKNAIRALGRAKNKAAARRHIKKRARQLGRTDLIPEEWGATMTTEDEDIELWASVANAWDPTMDLEYVRQQISAQLGSGYVMDEMGELRERRENDDRTPAHVYVVGMSAGRALLCAHAASDGEEPHYDVAEANGECRGWIAEFEVGDEGEVIVDPLDEWVAVEKKWVELSRDGMTLYQNESALPIVVENNSTLPGGGNSMADGKNDTPDETPAPKESKEEPVAFTREDAEKLADERATAALEAYRQEIAEKDKARDAELAASRRRLHEMSVKEQVAALEAAGHAPAVIKVAQEFLLADVAQEPALSFTREGEEVQPTVTEIVTELLASFPESALTRTEVALPASNGAPDSDSVTARADRIMEFINPSE